MKVSIRPLNEEDALISYKWRNDHDVFKYTGRTYDGAVDIECERQWLKEVIIRANEYRCAILADDKYVGNIYLTDITTESAVYHIFIGEKEYWGKGIAKQASKLILEYAFHVLGLSRVDLYVKQENEPAKGLYKKLGFEEQSFDGNWIHMVLFKECFSVSLK